MGLFNWKKKEEGNLSEISLKVEDMMCAHCEAHVKNAIMDIPGVKEASASATGKCVTAKVAEGVTADQLAAAIKECGYTVVE